MNRKENSLKKIKKFVFFFLTYVLVIIRRKGTTNPNPSCFFAFPTRFKPRKNKAVALKALPEREIKKKKNGNYMKLKLHIIVVQKETSF